MPPLTFIISYIKLQFSFFGAHLPLTVDDHGYCLHTHGSSSLGQQTNRRIDTGTDEFDLLQAESC